MQPGDDATAMEWADCLGALAYADAFAAVSELRDSGRMYPPQPGEVKQRALALGHRRAEQVRAGQRRLAGPRPHPSELARVKNMVADFFARHPLGVAIAKRMAAKGDPILAVTESTDC